MFPVLVSCFILAFVSGLFLLFCFLFLFRSSCSEGCPGTYFFLIFLSLVCFFPTFLALLDGSGHTFPFTFILWYALFLLFLLFRIARGILFSLFFLSGMPFSCFSCSFRRPGAYFSLTFLSLVCLFPVFHALLDAPGHTFFSPFSFWYAFFLLLTLF